LVLLFFAPHVALILHYDAIIYEQIQDVPPHEYAVVFGAYVEADGTLSDAALERVEGAVLLYQDGRVLKLFVSGTNRSNEQAQMMALHAMRRGIPEGDILVDGLGIDTHDTCRHFARVAQEGVLVTQRYHLPRAMYFCERDGVEVVGLAPNHLPILPERGSNLPAIVFTRVGRSFSESWLTWSFLLGIYDRVSQEAEALE
jgi:vancomycin permeability regulator SanA